MSFKWPTNGPNHVPAYQLSGIPYVTSSVVTEVPAAANTKAPIEVTFPLVTKFFKIRNTGANDLRVAFTLSGSYAPGETDMGNKTVPAYHSRNYFIIPSGSVGNTGTNSGGSTQTFDIRCKKLFFLADNTGTTGFSLCAGLTTITGSQFPTITGSVEGTTIYEGVG